MSPDWVEAVKKMCRDTDWSFGNHDALISRSALARLVPDLLTYIEKLETSIENAETCISEVSDQIRSGGHPYEDIWDAIRKYECTEYESEQMEDNDDTSR